MANDSGRLRTTVADPERMIVPVAIREDLTARLQIPVDLTLAEAEKIARVVIAYAMPNVSGVIILSKPSAGGMDDLA